MNESIILKAMKMGIPILFIPEDFGNKKNSLRKALAKKMPIERSKRFDIKKKSYSIVPYVS